MKFYHKKGTQVSIYYKSIYYYYKIVYTTNIYYLGSFQYFSEIAKNFCRFLKPSSTYSVRTCKLKETMKHLFLAIMMYYNNGDLNAEFGVPHYGSFHIHSSRFCEFNEDGTTKACIDKEVIGNVAYSLEDSEVVVNFEDDYERYEIREVEYENEDEWLIVTKKGKSRDYWCFNFNIKENQVMRFHVMNGKINYDGCIMFYFGNYIMG